ncbi:hypothetical protein [Marinoscillum sp. MHG1-6]|uniref:hypothetical protein n=1 Tax=Marinoscillum sp. MHG1-6 TaxID=2959627 RepID=UPI002157F019|nr:hypothetical protein [Marinoscillum sp. MHG1-6]
MRNIHRILFFVLIGMLACKNPRKSDVMDDNQKVIEYNNPPAEGFDVENSNVIAILLADQVMNAMGGREKWDNSHVFYWNFFGKRMLLWDKVNNMVRIDEPGNNQVTVVNLESLEGNSWVNGEPINDTTQLKDELEKAKRKWMNDSYWLFMPFKLKDSGVTLTYFSSEPTLTGEPCDVIGLSFRNVGATPDNAYHVWISVEDKLVKQWAFYKDFEDENPAFVAPWDNYESYNGLLLAAGRGDRSITDIKVLEKAPAGSFTGPEPINFPTAE